MALLKTVDAVTIPVPDLDAGIAFYVEGLRHRLLWRRDEVGQAGLRLPDGSAELVLTTRQGHEVDWLVEDAPAAAQEFVAAGGTLVSGPTDIPAGRLAVVQDPFGNRLVLLDLSKGPYAADEVGR